MTSMFRIATKEAIREMVIENCHTGRFGFVLTSEGLDLSTDRIVDLFETTLELRNKVREKMSANTQIDAAAEKSHGKEEKTKFPRTVNAAEIYKLPQPEYRQLHVEQVPQAPAFDHKLPRKRVSLTEIEREKIYRPN